MRAVSDIPWPVKQGRSGRFVFPGGFKPSRELVAALVDALDYERRTHIPDGVTQSQRYGEDDLSDALVMALIASHDAATIPALVPFSVQGVVGEALIGFGLKAVPALVKQAKDPDALAFPVIGAFQVLAAIVNMWEKEMSEETMASIREVTILHLGALPDHYASSKGHRRVIIFGSAMELASATQDPALLDILRLLAKDEREAVKRGVSKYMKPKDVAKKARLLLRVRFVSPQATR